MVTGALGIVIGVVGAIGHDGDAKTAVRSALSKGQYPWYDAKSDSVKPVWPTHVLIGEWLERNFPWLMNMRLFGSGTVKWGELLVIGLAMLALTVVIIVLIEAWRRYRPTVEDRLVAVTANANRQARIEGLPAGVRPDTDDPWNEAVRRRDRGDFAGAIVCLFAHQLLALDRIRMLRLVPGRTGRQLVGAIDDRPLRGCVEPTLRLFELVYYGHRVPSVESFEAVWALTESFERRVAEKVGT